MLRKSGLPRPQSATSRQESEMASDNLRQLQAGSAGMQPILRLRSLCLSRGANGFLALGRIFRKMDDEGYKQWNKQEFVRGLRKAGLEVSDEEAGAIFDEYVDHSSGRLNLTNFLVHVRPPLPECRQEVIDEAFAKMDVMDVKSITMEDLNKFYNVKSQPLYISGEESEEMIMERFLVNFEHDATEDGQITHEEFVNYYSAISASIDNDCYFNLIMRQAYKL